MSQGPEVCLLCAERLRWRRVDGEWVEVHECKAVPSEEPVRE